MEKNMRDDRSIAFNADLDPEGPLHELRNLVAAQDDLELCYRGNNRRNGGEKITIYYKNHVMFAIEKQVKKYVLTISFNHARYEEDWQEILDDLQKNHHFEKRGEKKIADVGDDGYLSCNFNNSDEIKWKELYSRVMPIMDNYFTISDEEVVDYFKSYQKGFEVKKERTKYVEKIMQQQIFSANTNCDDGYFFYDLEFSKPYPDMNAHNGDKNSNKPDMLAVKFENGRPTKLVFVELKTTKEACTEEKSNVEKHLTCMAGLLEGKNSDIEFIKARKDEVPKIIAHYAEIGLRGLEPTRKVEDFSNIDIELLLIFTDEAIEWGKENRKNMESWAKKYIDKLFIAQADKNGVILPL
ncbi:MAG: hypothetical protein AB9883_03630 [Acidaminococcaceae bacterium]